MMLNEHKITYNVPSVLLFQRGSSYGSLITAHGKYQLFAKTGYYKVRLSSSDIPLPLQHTHTHVNSLEEWRVGALSTQCVAFRPDYNAAALLLKSSNSVLCAMPQ